MTDTRSKENRDSVILDYDTAGSFIADRLTDLYRGDDLR
jgi:hypothetical protein